MAPTSCSTPSAHPRSVRIAGRLSLVISIEIAPHRDESAPPRSFPALSTGQGFPNGRAGLVHVFPSAVENAKDLAEASGPGRISPEEPGVGRRLMSSSVSEDSPWPLMRSLAPR